MPAEFVQGLAAGIQPLKQVKTFNGPGRAPAQAVFEADQGHGPMIGLRQAGRHNADHPGVPALSGQDQDRPRRQAVAANQGLGLFQPSSSRAWRCRLRLCRYLA